MRLPSNAQHQSSVAGDRAISPVSGGLLGSAFNDIYSYPWYHYQIYLPFEVWEAIAQLLRQCDLRSVSLVSSALRTVSARFLFKGIKIATNRRNTKWTLAKVNVPVVYQYAKAASLQGEVLSLSYNFTSLRRTVYRKFGISLFETAPQTFLRSIHSLKHLRTLKLDNFFLNNEHYVTILSAPSIQRLVLQRVCLCDRKRPKVPTKSHITDLELHWSFMTEFLAKQLFSDLANDLELYALHMTAPNPVELVMPRSPRLKSLSITCRGVENDTVFLSSLSAYIGGAESLVCLTVDIDAWAPLTRHPRILPRILRLSLRPSDLSFGNWTAGHQLDLLDVTQASVKILTLDRILPAIVASASISELRLRVRWRFRKNAFRRIATQRLPVTKLVVQIDHRDIAVEPNTATQDEEPWTGVEKIDIIVAWNGREKDLDDTRNFRKWVEERVEDGKSRIQNARFDIWRSPIGVWRAFDYEKDEVLWWETWSVLSRSWVCSGDCDLTRLKEGAIPW